MTRTYFSYDSATRVARATKWVEQQFAENNIDRWFRRGSTPVQPTIAFAKADIEHNQEGTVYLATGTPTNETASTDERQVYNTICPVIWENSPLVIEPPMVQEADADGLHWHVMRAYSATRIMGDVSGNATGPTQITLNNVVGMDGHFELSSMAVELLSGYRVKSGSGLIAVWNEITGDFEAQGCCDY